MRRVGYRHSSAVIGEPPQMRDYGPHNKGVQIHETATIEAFCSVDGGWDGVTTIGPDVWLMKSVHVGHDAVLERDVEIAPLSSIGGFVRIGAGATLGQGVIVKPYVTIGAGARIGMGGIVVHDVPAGEVWVGNPARRLEKPIEVKVATVASGKVATSTALTALAVATPPYRSCCPDCSRPSYAYPGSPCSRCGERLEAVES